MGKSSPSIPDRDHLISLYQDYTTIQIAKILGVPKNIVLRWFYKLDVPTRNPGGKRRAIPSVEELIELYENHNIPEIARMYGVSRQRIAEELSKVEAVTKKKTAEIDRLKEIREQEPFLSWQEIGKRIGKSESYCVKMARKYGISGPRKTLKPVGCPNCLTKPYAKGLCRNCYATQRRRNKAANNG